VRPGFWRIINLVVMLLQLVGQRQANPLPPGWSSGQTEIRSRHLQIGCQDLAAGLWAEQYRHDQANASDCGSDQHRDRKPHIPAGRKVGKNRSYQAAEDRSLVIDKTACRRPYFGGEPFGKIGRILDVHTAGAERPLQGKNTTIVV